MFRVLLICMTLLISFNVFAASSDLANAMIKSIKSQSNKNHSADSTLIYVGKDLSHPLIATAHEDVWSGQTTVIG